MKSLYIILPLTQGFVAIIDRVHWRQVNKYSWHTHKSAGKGRRPRYPYARATIDGRKIYLHVYVMWLILKRSGIICEILPNCQVDHKNHQTLDCRGENLEVVDPLVNLQRRRIKRRKSC